MPNRNEIIGKAKLVCDSLATILYEDDKTFLENMKAQQTQNSELKKYQHWEWTQGIGLYGFVKLYQFTGERQYLDALVRFYDERFEDGLPGKNVNTVAPMLAMTYVYEATQDEKYLAPITEWAEWVFCDMPRTQEKGLQHITSDCINAEELWDDTLVMTVLFLARAGMLLKRREYVEEAIRQHLLHVKYLADRSTGLWFHGWTFNGRHNFAKGLWGRGNSLITIGFPDFIEMLEGNAGVKAFLTETLEAQIRKLAELQDGSGLWHTVLDDPSSYVESSATAGFCYGILKAVRLGYIDEAYRAVGLKAVEALLGNIDEKGVVQQVSYGTPMGRESIDFYKEIPICPMPYGQAMVLLALTEVLMLPEMRE